MITFTTIVRGYCVTHIRLTIHISTVSYQWMPYCFYRKIRLMRLIYCYCNSIYNKYIIVLCFIFNHYKTFLISQISNQLICDIFKHNCSLQTSKSTTIQNIRSSTQRKHLNTELYQGSTYHIEGDRNSCLNCLASVIINQYTNVINQWYQLPWTWTWRIWYCGRWHYSEKRPGRA